MLKVGLEFLLAVTPVSFSLFDDIELSGGRGLFLSVFALILRRFHQSFRTERSICRHHTLTFIMSIKTLPLDPRWAYITSQLSFAWGATFSFNQTY